METPDFNQLPHQEIPEVDELDLLRAEHKQAQLDVIDSTHEYGELHLSAVSYRDHVERKLQLLENMRAIEAGETPPHVQHLGTVNNTEGSSSNWILHGGSRRVDVTGGRLSPDYGAPKGFSA